MMSLCNAMNSKRFSAIQQILTWQYRKWKATSGLHSNFVDQQISYKGSLATSQDCSRKFRSSLIQPRGTRNW